MIFEHRIWPDQPVNVSLPDDFGLDVIGTCTNINALVNLLLRTELGMDEARWKKRESKSDE